MKKVNCILSKDIFCEQTGFDFFCFQLRPVIINMKIKIHSLHEMGQRNSVMTADDFFLDLLFENL